LIKYTDEWWQGVKDFNNSFPINIFKKDKEMTASELADKLMSSLTMEYDCDKYMEQASAMLRKQQAEIEALEKAFEGERKYARYLSKLCIDNKIPIVWSF
jgi:hypothetical protein